VDMKKGDMDFDIKWETIDKGPESAKTTHMVCVLAIHGPASGSILGWSACYSFCPLWPDLQNILRQSYDYLTIMPMLLSTYDERLIYKTPYDYRKSTLR